MAGLADNYPVLVARGVPRSKRVLVIPSMNPEMWLDPFLQRNIDELNATQKYRVLCPSAGEMASGDFGIGAQVPMETIINESYRALGLIDPLVNESPRADRQDAARDISEPSKAPVVVVVEDDADLRTALCSELEGALSFSRVIGFATQPEVHRWLAENPASLVLSSLEFKDGSSGYDLIDLIRQTSVGSTTQIILMS